jgi:hypothetical protein
MNQKLIEKHWDINVPHDCYEWTIDDFKAQMLGVGIEVDQVYFSGFSSQGDGACFEGSVADWPLFLRSHGYDVDVLSAHARANWSFSVKQRGHYNHENCTNFDYGLPHPDDRYVADESFTQMYYPGKDRDTIAATAWLAILRNSIASGVEDEFIEVFKDYMRQVYSDLESEYDYLTSEEAVWEAIVANGLDTEENDDEDK